MKMLIQKLPLTPDKSFLATTFRTPNFEVPWHQHIEYELILITEGHGMSFIGNHIGEFKENDVFFLGSNLPHTFQKQGEVPTSAIVIQFTDSFWGEDLLRIPEANALVELFNLSKKGIKLEGETQMILGTLIRKLESATGFSRFTTLFNCLDIIIGDKEKKLLSTSEIKKQHKKFESRLDETIQYTIANFQQPISLEQVAKIANMSVTSFCSYFKKVTKKTYIEFLIEIRISYACKLLQDSDKPIADICYESGYNTPINFNKQFFKINRITPSRFRREFKKTF